MQRQPRAISRITPALLLLVLGASCPDSPVLCLSIAASQRLNLFEGEPHVVALYFYPLQNATAFQEADSRDLLRRPELAGQTGAPFETTILPGEQRDLEEVLPRDTALVGIIADFYSGPSKVVIEPRCRAIVLSSSDIQMQ